MTKKSFQRHFSSEIEQINLSERQLEELQNLQNGTYKKSKNGPTTDFKRYIITAAIICILPLALIAQKHWQKEQLINSIADEIALNHYKLKPLEIKSQSFGELNSYFTKLDFATTKSDIFSLTSNSLLGGRYCSIQGVSAAQIRYTNDTGGYTTLYQTVNTGDQFNAIPNIEEEKKPVETHARGFKIRIWREKGLIFASVNE